MLGMDLLHYLFLYYFFLTNSIVFGGKLFTNINGWFKVACIPELMKVGLKKPNYF